MGTQIAPAQLFYDFNMEEHVPTDYLLRKIDQFLDLSDIRAKLKPFYSSMGHSSIDPQLLIRMPIIGYCYGIRSERRICKEWPDSLNQFGISLGEQTSIRQVDPSFHF